MFPNQIASMVTGLPTSPKKSSRGKKGKGRPGSAHLAALQKAHGAGDFQSARTHALNYAKSTLPSMAASPSSDDADSDMVTGADQGDAPDAGTMPKAAPVMRMAKAPALPSTKSIGTAPKGTAPMGFGANSNNKKAQLAAMMLKRRKTL